ncbi:MAG: PPOX class F420-dependent oxidoreductase [Nocardiaceae bacterium]|nr:PPOX class F420-dependent oxidoreductase [Nocardiaceae bacterium]
MTTFAELGTAKYMLLTSFRKNGVGVATPVWFAPDGDAFVVWTTTDSGKVKRIRRDSRVTVARCDRRGKPSGKTFDAVAEIHTGADAERIRQLIAKHYGLLGRLLVTASSLRRGHDGTVGLRIVSA